MEKSLPKYTLPKVFKHRWIKALRSGYYKKAKTVLHNYSLVGKDSYCCLGVACKISGVNSHIMDSTGNGHIKNDRKFKRLPMSLRKDGAANELQVTLIKLNDGLVDAVNNPNHEEHSFDEIADWIEKNVAGE